MVNIRGGNKVDNFFKIPLWFSIFCGSISAVLQGETMWQSIAHPQSTLVILTSAETGRQNELLWLVVVEELNAISRNAMLPDRFSIVTQARFKHAILVIR